MNSKITVTSPLLPNLQKFKNSLNKIWQSKFITNNGQFHQEFQKKLCEYLNVPYISIFTNGTLPLLAALKILDISGDVITTPYSFVATSNVLFWRNINPIFVDVDQFGNIDPNKIQSAITEKTTAILAVHVYGNPYQTQKIQQIANKHNLKIIYDAAHSFGVQNDNKSILLEGDLSTLSFHATKVFNSIEGGAIVCKSKQIKDRLDKFKNFGFEDEVTVSQFGINCKMDQIRSAYGILNLQQVDFAIAKRKFIASYYREKLKNIKGISFFNDIENIKHNYSYFPIFINQEYNCTRDQLYQKLKQNNILSRRYFYPLITDFSVYEKFKNKNLINAQKIANSVLCLPMHHQLKIDDLNYIIGFIK